MTWTVAGLESEIRARGGSVTLSGAITAATLAAVLDVSPRTLERWREMGTGPASFTSNGLPTGRRYYRVADVVGHLNASAQAA